MVFDNIQGYERAFTTLAIVGRTAGRIKRGKSLHTLYQLETNCENNLHGYPEFYGQKNMGG